MRTWMMSLAHFPCCLLLATVVIGTSIIHAEPEPMARLTRPKVFGSPEEFKKYANLVKDYFFALGKARFGKRDDIALPMSTELSNWEILRMIQNAQRQKKIRQNKEVLFHDFQSSDIDKHTSSVPARPGSLSDMINNYDDVQ
ncbi:hypothetical protein ACFW04_010268 [Cataglyphis niger]|uniref:Neuropeptide F n=1 Tax=Cataglyphis nodus TaxID=606565 RepID=A0A8A4ZSU9_9HYME|nr:neuropeptide F [Cataglyphis nodus]